MQNFPNELHICANFFSSYKKVFLPAAASVYFDCVWQGSWTPNFSFHDPKYALVPDKYSIKFAG